MKRSERRVGVYVRVSTSGQTTENQKLELEAVAVRMGWTVVGVYEDAGISGAKGRAGRPEFDRLCKDAARRQFDIVMAWSVDRLGRSLQDLVGFLGDLHTKKVDLYLHQQGLDTSTPSGKAMFQMLGVFAEFERAMIRERVNAGLARAKAQGKVLGRPKLGQERDPRGRDARQAIEKAIRKSLATGTGMLKTAREHKVGVSLVQRIKREMAAA
jgi:DNA invertase Pin-like site-specific DNA recombinase